jgi:hypothetical protein
MFSNAREGLLSGRPFLLESIRKVLVMAKKHHELRKNFFDHHEWWFVALGLIGNMMFFIGSICFLFKPLETTAIGFFIFGSGLMLVSSSAESLAEYSRNKLKQREERASRRSANKLNQTEYSA